MIYTFLILTFGIYIGQEYKVPSVKTLYANLLVYLDTKLNKPPLVVVSKKEEEKQEEKEEEKEEEEEEEEEEEDSELFTNNLQNNKNKHDFISNWINEIVNKKY